MPRNRAKVIHSGSLSKRGRKRPTFSRYWFILRDDSLSYYSNSTDLYFPSGTIDLRYAIQAEIVGQDKKTSSHFTILTENRSYHFKADSPKSAHEWVKSLQREIFRSRNEGDSVKIVIPVGNVIDLEQSSILDMALSLKIRAIDGEETYAIDEYVFTFFRRAEEVVEHIKSAMKKLGVSGLAIEEKEKDLAKNDIIKSEPISPFFEPIIDSTDVSVPRFSLPGSTSETQPQLQRRGRSLLSTRFRSRSPSASGTGAKSSSSKGSLQQRNAWSPSPMRSITGRMKHLFEDSSREHSPSASGTTSPNNSQSNSPVSHPEFFLSAAAAASALKKSEKHLSETYDFLNASDTHQLPSENLKHKKRFSMVNKVTEMWGGGKKHFKTPDEALSMREDRHLVSEQEGVESNERFRHHFSLSEGESLVATYFCYIQKALPIYGKMYLGTHNLCFRSLFPGISTKMILPITDIENVTKEKGFRFGYSGLVVVIHGHEEVFFEFGAGSNRDDCEVMLLRALDRSKQQNINLENSSDSSYYATRAARLCTYEDVLRNELEFQAPPLIISDDTESVNELECFLNGPQRSYKFTLLTIGSRGDVQPYIALAKGLLLEGHKVRIATHAEFRPWIEKYGIEFAEIAGDPAQLMKIMGEHGKFSVSFVREAASRFRSWIDELLSTSWTACQGSDIIIESPSAMAGIHIAEALEIPYFRAFTMPWTRTRAYPHAFIVPEQKMGGSYNYLTYVMFDNVFWKGISGQVNRWRKRDLHLPRTSLDQIQQSRVPFMYSVSPSVLVPPVDFSDWVRVTGYWFLDESDNYTPDPALVDFIAKARADKAKLVYIGFGSIVVSNPTELTKAVVESVLRADIRCILSKGWSDRLGDKDSKIPEIPLPPEIFQIDSAPHDWLFPQMDAAVHHGGSGTTGASLRFGLPTIIKPFFGDQFFYANRVEDLGAGIHLKKLTVNQFSKALWEVTHNERIISRAVRIGNEIKAENGVQNAIQFIYRQMDYAKSLIKTSGKNEIGSGMTSIASTPVSTPSEEEGRLHSTDDSWTFIEEGKD